MLGLNFLSDLAIGGGASISAPYLFRYATCLVVRPIVRCVIAADYLEGVGVKPLRD